MLWACENCLQINGIQSYFVCNYLKVIVTHLSVVQLSVHIDLALGDVASEIGNRMSDIVVGHSENGDLRNGPVPTLHTSSSLQEGEYRCISNY